MRSFPGILATRAVNQYRKRDVIGYLGLRLYLQNKCAVRDQWAREIACLLRTNDPRPKYHESRHFKGQDDKTNDREFRRLCLPTPNEILAETALIGECAKIGGSFLTHPSAYSYQIAQGNDQRGIFVPYFSGFKRRHKGIRDAVQTNPNCTVLYTDIRKFYPNIEHSKAVDAWTNAAVENALNPDLQSLGVRLLEGYRANCTRDEKGILTGPMFSHFVANLIFRSIDEALSDFLPDGYFRYVDDIAFVGEQEKVLEAEKILERHLDQLCGLKTHPKKRMEISGQEWLKGANDFDDEPEKVSWRSFVGKIKQMLIAKPDQLETITSLLNENGFRLRPIDYSDAVKESSYLERIRVLASEKKWFRQSIRKTTPTRLLTDAHALRARYAVAFWDWIDTPVSSEYDKKRRIHGLRRYASRLIYLADARDLNVIVEALEEIPELKLYTVIFNALDTGDISELVHYGASAAQSAAMPLLATHQHVVCSTFEDSIEVRQAKAVLLAYGVQIEEQRSENLIEDEMIQFCSWDSEFSVIAGGRVSTYFDELACLHGFNTPCRHQSILSTAFDLREDVISDISELLGNSPS